MGKGKAKEGGDRNEGVKGARRGGKVDKLDYSLLLICPVYPLARLLACSPTRLLALAQALMTAGFD